MAAYTDRANVKAVLRVPAGVTRHDALIDLYLAGIDAEMLSLLGQNAITQATYSETYDVDGVTAAIQLRNWPCTNIAAVTNNDSAVASTDYYIDPETRSFCRLKSLGSYFTPGPQQVQITYTAGLTQVPGDLTLCASLIVAHRVNTGGHGGLQGESSGGYSYDAAKDAGAYLPPAALAIINKRRPLLR
jgi:hypothetical protein